MCRPVHKGIARGLASGLARAATPAQAGFQVIKFLEEFRMSSRFQNRGFIVALLGMVFAFLCGSSPRAAAQDQPAPKWELSGQYSFFYPGADVHGVLPLGLFPLSSRLESN